MFSSQVEVHRSNLYIFTVRCALLKKVTNLFLTDNWCVIVKWYIFYDWQVDTSIILFCSQSCCVHKTLRCLLTWCCWADKLCFIHSSYQIDAASQLFIYLILVSRLENAAAHWRVFLGFAFQSALGLLRIEHADKMKSERECQLWFDFLCRYGASRDSIHKLSLLCPSSHKTIHNFITLSIMQIIFLQANMFRRTLTLHEAIKENRFSQLLLNITLFQTRAAQYITHGLEGSVSSSIMCILISFHCIHLYIVK